MHPTPTNPTPETAPRFRAGDRDWTVRLNVGLAKRLRDELQLDVVNLNDGQLFYALRDPFKLYGALWLCCERQAEAAAVEPEAFSELLDGDRIAEAFEALCEAIVLFSQPPFREAIRNLVAKTRHSEDLKAAAAVRLVNSPESDQQISRAIAEFEEKAKRELTAGD